MSKVVIVSVGGSHEPIVHCLNQQKPPYVIYFTSPDSRKMVRQKIEPELTFTIKDLEFIVTPDPENLLESVAQIMRRLPSILDTWKLTPKDLTGDYTGGTKTMSAALVLALIDYGCPFSYVGGTTRDKQGLGIVLRGKERMLHISNPWDTLAVNDLRDIALLFNKCRFLSARDRAERAAQRTRDRKDFFQTLATAIEGYGLWDSFDYGRALGKLGKARGIFTNLGQCAPLYQEFARNLVKNHEELKKIKEHYQAYITDKTNRRPPLDGTWLVRDLVANAIRRGEVEHKYHDAVVRLYSALEKIAKLRLLHHHGIDNSNADLDHLPDPALGAELERTCRNSEGKIQIGLFKSFQLLKALSDPLGEKFLQRADDMRKIMDVRNHCILNHGFRAVQEKTYLDFKSIVMDFAEIRQERLPRFPHMDWRGAFL